jgi:LPXTG-motif cell wall-anchored protein
VVDGEGEMMRRAIFAISMLAAAVAMPSALAAAPRVEVAELLADPAAFSVPAVPEVRVRGELVGDFGRRGNEVWAQLNGDAYAERPLLDGGDHRGAIVEVTGAWRFHDPGRGGESYLDATAIEVIAPDLPLAEAEQWWALWVGAALLGAAGVMALRSRRFGRD